MNQNPARKLTVLVFLLVLTFSMLSVSAADGSNASQAPLCPKCQTFLWEETDWELVLDRETECVNATDGKENSFHDWVYRVYAVELRHCASSACGFTEETARDYAEEYVYCPHHVVTGQDLTGIGEALEKDAKQEYLSWKKTEKAYQDAIEQRIEQERETQESGKAA